MSDKSQVLCKYHVAGVCRFGADCAFSHDLADLPSQVCKYYLAGCCAYGDRCRYDHKRPDYWKAKHDRAPGQQGQQAAPRTAGGPRAAAGSGGGGRAVAAPGDPYTQAWDAPEPHDPSRPPRAAAAAAGFAAGRPTAAAVAGEERAEESWEALYGAEGQEMCGDAEYDEYGDEGQQAHGEEYGEACYGGELPPGGGAAQEEGVWWAAGAGPEAEAEAEAGGGLVMVDDDVGLEEEARALARRGRVVPPHPPAAAAAAGSQQQQQSAWAAERHPWEVQGAGQGGGSGGGGGGGGARRVAPVEPVDPADVELCPAFALHGRCSEGEDCPLIHGLECEVCHKFRLHPYRPEAAADHVAACRLRHGRLEARLRSAGVECGICLEPVLGKACVSERRFGLLACDHAFCLACIRSWRERGAADSSLAVDSAVRSCPVCRARSHFVTPSPVWPASPEEKEAIVSAYRDKLATIDCRHFDFGDGTCPFSTSCFYRHMYRDGRMEEPTLRRAGDADGCVRVVTPLRLSAFLDTPHAQRLLGRRR